MGRFSNSPKWAPTPKGKMVKVAITWLPILLKFCMVTPMKVLEGQRGSTLEPEVEFRRQLGLHC